MTPLLAQCGRKYAGQTGQMSTIVSGKYNKEAGININHKKMKTNSHMLSKFVFEHSLNPTYGQYIMMTMHCGHNVLKYPCNKIPMFYSYN